MPSENPDLLSIALMVREDRKALFVRHAQGPFGGRWSLPLIGVAPTETAEDAIERLMRDYLHVEPGPYEFLDTLYLNGSGGERFIANGFTCIDWTGEPRFPAQIFDDAIWAPPSEAAALELLPEMRDWIATIFPAGADDPAVVTYDAQSIIEQLSEARGELLATFDEIPYDLRHTVLDEGGWTPADVLLHVVDVEAYYHSEVVRCLDEGARLWRQFNPDQWDTLRRLRPAEEEAAVRERMDVVRDATRKWLTYQPPETLNAYINHPERGVVQAGDRIAKIADHDRQHTGQLRSMAQAAALQSAADARAGEITDEEDARS